MPIFLFKAFTIAVTARKLRPIQFNACVRYFTTNSIANEHSFAASYLINRCGFTPQSALAATKYTHFETPDKPDSVLAFLENHGFSKAQISAITRRFPVVLLSDVEKTLLPKLDFLYSKGASKADVSKIVTGYPAILKRSLENQIIPSFKFFYELLQSDEMVIASAKRNAGILCFDVEGCLITNINALQDSGVPKSHIAALVRIQPRTILTSTDKFKEAVERAKRMRFDPLKKEFIYAVFVLRTISKQTWETKVDAYKRWGLTEKEIFSCFRKRPLFMTVSVDKITAMMDFFVNKMDWKPSTVVRYPTLVSLSLEKRIVPRVSVVQVLISKGLMKKIPFSRVFYSSEKSFILQYVSCHEEKAQLLKLYKEKMER